MAIAVAESGFNGGLDLVGLGLPCSQADGGDFGARVESVCSTGIVSVAIEQKVRRN